MKFWYTSPGEYPINVYSRILFPSKEHRPCESSKDSSPRTSMCDRLIKFFHAPPKKGDVALRDLHQEKTCVSSTIPI